MRNSLYYNELEHFFTLLQLCTKSRTRKKITLLQQFRALFHDLSTIYPQRKCIAQTFLQTLHAFKKTLTLAQSLVHLYKTETKLSNGKKVAFYNTAFYHTALYNTAT